MAPGSSCAFQGPGSTLALQPGGGRWPGPCSFTAVLESTHPPPTSVSFCREGSSFLTVGRWLQGEDVRLQVHLTFSLTVLHHTCRSQHVSLLKLGWRCRGWRSWLSVPTALSLLRIHQAQEPWGRLLAPRPAWSACLSLLPEALSRPLTVLPGTRCSVCCGVLDGL